MKDICRESDKVSFAIADVCLGIITMVFSYLVQKKLEKVRTGYGGSK